MKHARWIRCLGLNFSLLLAFATTSNVVSAQCSSCEAQRRAAEESARQAQQAAERQREAQEEASRQAAERQREGTQAARQTEPVRRIASPRSDYHSIGEARASQHAEAAHSGTFRTNQAADAQRSEAARAETYRTNQAADAQRSEAARAETYRANQAADAQRSEAARAETYRANQAGDARRSEATRAETFRVNQATDAQRAEQIRADRLRVQQTQATQRVEQVRADSLRVQQTQATQRADQIRADSTLLDQTHGTARSNSEEFSRFAQTAFASRFSESLCLQNLWNQASLGLPNTPDGFAKARANFWTLVNSSWSTDAGTVRAIIMAAGYELQTGNNAPLLNSRGWDRKATRELTDRRLTIDHADPKSVEPGQTLNSSNLRFMSQRDNSFRGNRYGADDQPRNTADLNVR
jgi:hypothetical protein